MRMGGHQRGLRRRRGQPTWNAALQLFLLATLKGFHLEWPRGEDQLLLVSVGTGYDVPRLSAEETVRALPADLAVRSLTSMMGDVEALARLMLQRLGKTLFSMPKEIDSEVGDLSADTLDGRKLLTSVRYNAFVNRAWLTERLQLELTERGGEPGANG
jgi:hypothetical protein